MALVVRKIGELEELNTYLRGGIIGGKNISRGIYGLNGLTLVFTTPVATVTLATTPANDQIALSAKDILAQINAVIAGYAKIDSSGKLVIENPAGGNVVMTATSTADTKLGFGKDGASGALHSKPGGAAPSLVDVSLTSLGGGTYLLVTDE